MSPEKYNRVKEIFLAACEKPQAEQEGYVLRECGGDEEIQREVEGLLREHRRPVQVMPQDPENPLGSMSSLLSRANIELGEEVDPEDGEGKKGQGERAPGDFLEDSSLGSGSSSGIVDAGRFMAGTMVAGRYRIIELLGRGGMGEVYRADDTTLNQSVALKFLPALFGSDEKWLERFRNEVRLSRQVTHPNVCRVFDIGEFQGEQFISMEYVDGENLASLLRRIGRLPHDKGLQISRQLCAGLAAAHDRGVLHRDLKPANVMIDGRGAVRITDFGLAAPVDQMHKEAIRAGTPAYMAPEQLAGKPVTVRSDVYSLGLLLYEMFTGRRAFKATSLQDYKKLHSSEEPTPPSEIVEDIDPIVERVILKCMEKDPKNRPANALAVSAALPGGDPLREILAAGETPSPKVVAAAGEAQGGLKRWVAAMYLVVGLMSLVLVVFMAPRAFLVQQAIKDKSPEVLADRASTILRHLGYEGNAKDRAYGFALNQSLYDHVAAEHKGPHRWKDLISPVDTASSSVANPGFVYFWYRESPSLLVPLAPDTAVHENDPPPGQFGSVEVRLDSRGNLIGLEARPKEGPPPKPAVEATTSSARVIVPQREWWDRMLAQAGFLSEAGTSNAFLMRSAPTGPTSVYCDTRLAWDTTLGSDTFHVEEGAYQGRAVYFALQPPWQEKKRFNQTDYVQMGLSAGLLFAGAFLAWRNYRSGRGDRIGAMRMALAFFVFGFIAWLLRAHHVPDLLEEFAQFRKAVGAILYPVSAVWIFYLALEPYVRRVWPETVISWSRMLSGKWFDPLVGRDILIGSAAGAVTMVIEALDLLVPRWLGMSAPLPSINWSTHMLSSVNNLSTAFSGAITALYVALILLLFLVLMRMALRHKAAVVLAFIVMFVAATGRDPVSYVGQGIIGLMFLFVLMRHGLVALVFCVLIQIMLGEFPITPDLNVWYWDSAVVGIGCTVAALGASFYAALGGRSPITIRALGS